VTPAQAGTLVTVLMFVAIIPTATLAGILAVAAVEKIFFAVVGLLVYVYLFFAVGGSFERKFGFVSNHPWAIAIAAVVGVIVVLAGGSVASRWLRRKWEEARAGAKILSDRRAYVRRVVAPQVLSWGCKIGVVAVLLAAYGIPVGFHTIFSVTAGNSLANVVSVTPGGAGVNQAVNSASLTREDVDRETALAYSAGQQLVTTAWNVALAVVLVAIAFGWAGGKTLVASSYHEARARAPGRGRATVD